MRRLFILLFLLLLGSTAFADSSNSDILNPDAVNRYTDMSVFYLSQLFGTVGNVLTSNTSQMMGHLFYKLNWGIFLISSVVIFYSVLMGTLKLASEGVTMAPGKAALFSLVKLAIGISLVIPSAGTGYCVLQTVVMQVVVKGVGLADSIWSAGLDYLNQGGSMWSVPSIQNPTAGYSDLFKGGNLEALLGKDKLAAQIFQNEVCMIGSRDPLTMVKQGDASSIAADTPSRLYYDIQIKQDKMVFDFPGLTDDSVSTGHSCGTISWNVLDSCHNGDNSNCAITRNAMSKLVYGLLPVAKQYYCYFHGSKDSCVGFDTFSGLYSGLSPYLVNALIDYYPSIKAFADLKAKSQERGRTDFIANAKRDGWLMAGRYYWDVMKFVRLNDQVKDLSGYTTPAQWDGPSNISMAGNLAEIILKSKGDFDSVFHSGNFLEALDGVTNQGDKELKGKGNLMNGLGPILGTYAINPGVSDVIAIIVSGFNEIGLKFQSWGDTHYNPIEFMYSLGKACLNLTFKIWILGGIALSLGVALTSICSASNPWGYASSALIEWMRPIFMLIAGMLWMAGFFLSYYVPLYPFMFFLFASFGWFVSVIEAMVAAPLVALSMTHPESHDLLGKSEQGLMLLLSVFIQPSLLVLGLMAGIVLSYVSFELLIYTFSGFVADVLQSGSVNAVTTSNILAAVQNSKLYDQTNLLVAPLLLIVFCTMTYTLLTQSFSLVYLLRDNVMKWIGVSSTGIPNVEHMLSDTKSAASSMGQRVGSASSEGVMGGSKSMGESLKAGSTKAQENHKASGLDGGGDAPPTPPVA